MVGTSLIAVALSILTVGVVWAGSSAMRASQNTSVDSADTTVPTEGELPDLLPDEPSDATPTEKLADVIAKLQEQVNTLQEKVDAFEQDIIEARKSAVKAQATADDAITISKESRNAADAATSASADAKAAVGLIEKRTVKLTDEGVYTGSITPNQLSRKLAIVDLSGDWPLERTSGELSGEKIKMTGANCWTDYRYNVLVTPDTFRGLTCLKVLK